jgi:hypothetical protein
MVSYFKKLIKTKILKRRKKILGAVYICLLNSKANSAQFWWKWAGLAVVFSKQILNNSQFFFLFNIFYFLGMKPLRPMPAHFWHLIFYL